MIDANEYMRGSNEQKFVVIQIEDPEPMEELDEICSVEGIDMIFFGPADFSQGAGYPNEFNNPKLIEAKKRVAYAAREHGKFAGTVGGPANQDSLIQMGYQFINLGSDVGALINAFRDIASSCSGKSALAFENIK
jgi:4-hydroxy-2-oxoheptanedioate aldolase